VGGGCSLGGGGRGGVWSVCGGGKGGQGEKKRSIGHTRKVDRKSEGFRTPARRSNRFEKKECAKRDTGTRNHTYFRRPQVVIGSQPGGNWKRKRSKEGETHCFTRRKTVDTAWLKKKYWRGREDYDPNNKEEVLVLTRRR